MGKEEFVVFQNFSSKSLELTRHGETHSVSVCLSLSLTHAQTQTHTHNSGSVQPLLTRSLVDLVWLLEKDLPVEGERGQHVLLEHAHVVRPQPEEIALLEEGVRRLHRVFARHDVPAMSATF